MPKRTQLTDAEGEQRRAAGRAFLQQAVEQLRSSEARCTQLRRQQQQQPDSTKPGEVQKCLLVVDWSTSADTTAPSATLPVPVAQGGSTRTASIGGAIRYRRRALVRPQDSTRSANDEAL
jgi:hypothetical protein